MVFFFFFNLPLYLLKMYFYLLLSFFVHLKFRHNPGTDVRERKECSSNRNVKKNVSKNSLGGNSRRYTTRLLIISCSGRALGSSLFFSLFPPRCRWPFWTLSPSALKIPDRLIPHHQNVVQIPLHNIYTHVPCMHCGERERRRGRKTQTQVQRWRESQWRERRRPVWFIDGKAFNHNAPTRPCLTPTSCRIIGKYTVEQNKEPR